MSRSPLKSRIARAVSRLDAKSHRIERAYLFGSTARENRLHESDVDLIVVSYGFEGVSVPKRQWIVQREWNYPEELQALCYTPEEFEEVSKRATMREILSYAIDISPSRGSICPRCGRRGSRQMKAVKNKIGKPYRYLYFAHYERGKIRWCYIGSPEGTLVGSAFPASRGRGSPPT